MPLIAIFSTKNKGSIRPLMKTRSRSWLISFVSLPGILLLISLLGCEQFGNPPSGSSLDTIKLSPNYHLEDRIFVNQSSGILKTMGDGLSLWSDPFGKKRPNFLFNKMQSRPEKHLPEITNSNLKEFQDSQKNIKFI